MKKELFSGVCTALITPFSGEKVDYGALKDILEFQIREGVDAVAVCATTGEAPTLTDEEHLSVIAEAVKIVGKRIPVIAGTGSNYTAHAVDMSREAQALGADGLLLVTPYYNRATQKGLVQHYYKIADSTDLPAIVYNVPSRTGVNILPETYRLLTLHDKIVGIKEANGNLTAAAHTMALCSENTSLYSGNDDQIVPFLSIGGSGVISVLSNVAPALTVQICRSFFEGNTEKAWFLQKKALPLIAALFSEVNPIPVKCAMSLMGFCKNELRLPLTPIEPEHYEVLKAEMKKLELI